jgi:hypothetical protein
MAFMQRTFRLAAALAIAGLGACQASGGSFASLGGSPSGVPIAFVSIDGPPAPVRSALTDELVTAAASRQIEIAGAGAPARYQVRGYLSAETSASGETALAYVWDMFDAEKRRAKRLTGTSPVPVSAADPWSGLDQAALARVAAASMDEIAGFLTEAKSEASAGL